MELNNACGCQAGTEEANSIGSDSSSSKGSPCQMFSDPNWIKDNMMYFPAGYEADNGISKDITPMETLEMLQEGSQDKRIVILDVKTEQEYLDYHLSDSRHMDFFSSTFKDDLFQLDKNEIYIVICKVGVRSEIAMKLMKKMGFTEVYNVMGGDDRWFAEELPDGRENQLSPA